MAIGDVLPESATILADAHEVAVGVDRIVIVSPAAGRWVGEIPPSLGYVLRQWQTGDMDTAHAMSYCHTPWHLTLTCVELP
jgi:hypothetical protein